MGHDCDHCYNQVRREAAVLGWYLLNFPYVCSHWARRMSKRASVTTIHCQGMPTLPFPETPAQATVHDRREAMAAMASFGAAALLPGVLPACAALSPRRSTASANGSLIRQENARPGTRDWLLKNPQLDPSTKYRSPGIEGYASHTSARAGDVVQLFVSTNPAASFEVDLYRMGHYGGMGARLVQTLGPFKGRVQEDPPEGPGRMRECRWEATTSIAIPEDWCSGVYLAKLRVPATGVDSFVTFVVRDDRKVDCLVQVSDTTWQAYNRWPQQHSLYDDGKDPWFWGAGSRVTFDRPYGRYCQFGLPPQSQGSGEFLLWEFPTVFWLESQGFDVSYISNLDVHADAPALLRGKGLISMGHDEYYSLPMFYGLKSAISSGLSVAFLSGNTCCGLIDVGPASDGRPNRTLHRLDRYGPRDAKGDATFVKMSTLPRTAPNEASLVGARSTGPVMGGAAWTCRKPDHWLFAGTGMKAGDGVPGLVGWEFHGDPATDIPGLEVVAGGPTKGPAGPSEYAATLYPGPKGNIVFNAATCWWSDGLSAPPGHVRPTDYEERFGPDPRVARITRNLIERMKTG